MSFLSFSPSVRSHDAGSSVARSTSTDSTVLHPRLHNLRSVHVDLLRPAHASVYLRVEPCALPARTSIPTLRQRFSTNCLSARREDLVFNERQVCHAKNSRSFQGSFWFLQFSRPFQDLENGFWNSSTFQGFQGPYSPWTVSYLTLVARQAKTAFLHGPTVWKSLIVGIKPATFRSESAAPTTAPR